MVYEWKDGFRHAGVDPTDAAVQLERIRRTYNTLTSELIVEDSRQPDAALHPFFEWDDSEAARRFRLNQASTVLGALVVVAEDDDDMPVPVHRAYVRVASIDETEEELQFGDLTRIKRASRFERVDIALSDDVLRARVLESAWRELESWRQRYADYQELARMCVAIDEERRRVGRLVA